MIYLFLRAVLIACTLFLVSCSHLANESNSQRCSKSCLMDITEAYLEAKTYNRVADLPLAANVRATSNSQVVRPGSGETWQDGVSVVNRFTFVDPDTQSIIFFGTVAGAPAQPRQWWHYAVRLKINPAGEIVEIEEQSNTKGFKSADKVEVPFREAAIFNATLPKSERVGERQLIAVADAYWDALSTGEGGDVPFGPDCQRTEFGSFSTNSPLSHDRNASPDFVPQQQVGRSCRTFFDGPRFRWPTDNRRYYIVDVDRGVVVGVGQLNKFGEDGIPGLTLIEAFKVRNGRIEWLWAPAFNWGTEDSGWPNWSRSE